MAGRPRDERTAERFLVDVEAEKLRAQALLALVDAAPGAIDELGPRQGPAADLRSPAARHGLHDRGALAGRLRARHARVGGRLRRERRAHRCARLTSPRRRRRRGPRDRQPRAPVRHARPRPLAARARRRRPVRRRLAGAAARAARRERRHDRAARRAPGASLHDCRARAGPGRLCAIVTQAVADSRAFAKYLPAAGAVADGGGAAGHAAGPHAAERTLVDIARRLAEGSR